MTRARMRRLINALLAISLLGGLLPALAVLGAPVVPAAAEEEPPPDGGPVHLPPDTVPDLAPPGTPPNTELPSLRTLGSKTFTTDTPGQYRTTAHAGVIHFRNAAGELQDIDPSLVAGTVPGTFKNAANSFQLELGPDAASPTLARLRVDAAHSVAFGLLGALPVPGVHSAADHSLTFVDALPGVTVKLTSRKNGLKEDLVLASPLAPDTYIYPLQLEGLTALNREDGAGVEFVDETGATVVRAPNGYMQDSAVDPMLGEGATSWDGVKVTVVPFGVGQALQLKLDRAWLDNPARVYPVTVDPILTPQPQAGFDDTSVWTGYGPADNSHLTELRVGTYWTPEEGTHTTRSFLHFDLSGVNNKAINFAQLYLFESHSWSCDDSQMDVWRVTSDWNGSAVTSFATPPSPNVDTNPIHRSSFADGYTSSCPDKYQVLDTTQAVRNWANGTWANKGVALVSTAPESNNYGFKRFHSENAGVNVPIYNIDWAQPVPDVPVHISPANGSVFTSTPSLTARYRDPYNNWGYVHYEIRRQSDNAVVQSAYGPLTCPNSCNSTFTPNALPNGVYTWRTYAHNNYATSATSAPWTFTVDGNPPGAPTITSSTHPSQTSWYANNSPSFAWTATSPSGISGYSYVLDQVSNTTPDMTSEGTGTTKSYTGLADGEWWFHVRAKNGTGSWGDAGHYRVRIDVTNPNAPAVTSSTHPDQNAWYSNNSPAFSWSASDTSGINGYSWVLDQTSGTTPPAASQGTATTASYTGLADGIWYFHVRARNGAGLWGAPAEYRVKIDTGNPGAPTVTSSTHPDQNAWYSSNSPSFAWSATDALSGVAEYSYVLDQSAATAPDTQSEGAGTAKSYSGLPDGVWWFHVKARDAAGNWGAPSHYRVQIDATDPAAPAISSATHPDQNAWYGNNSPTFTWTASDTSGITGYSYVLDQVSTTTPDTTSEGVLTTKSYLALADGTWYFHVRAKNGTGAWGAPGHYRVQIDNSSVPAPTVSSSTHPNQNNWYTSTSPSLSWTAAAPSGIIGYSYALDQVSDTTPDTTSEGTGTSTSYSGLADGAWWFHVRAKNGAGAWGPPAHFRIQIDASKPATQNIAVSSSTHPDQGTWYANDDPAFEWSASDVSGIDGYSYVLDQSSGTTPDTTSEGAGTSTSFADKNDGVWYVHLRARNRAGLWSDPVHYTVRIEDAAPGFPAVTSSTHPVPDQWYSNNTPQFSWTPPSSLSGITGYSIVLSAIAREDPDTVAETSGTSWSYGAQPDGTLYFHIRARNGAGTWGPTTDFPIHIDTGAPTPPAGVTSPTHPVGVTQPSRSVRMDWNPGADLLSGVAGYSLAFNTNPTTAADATVDVDESTTTTTQTLTDGTWYFHIRTVDAAGNASTDVVYGPIVIDGLAPVVTKGASRAGGGGGPWHQGERPMYMVTLTNQNTSAMTIDQFRDELPDSLIPVPGGIWVDNSNGCSSPVSCTYNGNTLEITGITIPALSSVTVMYEAVIDLKSLQCQEIVNTVQAASGTHASSATNRLTACDSGLGVEPWWSYVRESLGPQAEAMVNPANGNLVVRHTDSTPIQAHGRLAYVLRRTYNSQDTTLAELTGGLGAGWTLNVAQADDLAAAGITPGGLYVPQFEGLSPGAVTVVDRDGTRHVFRPRSLGAAIEVFGPDSFVPARLKPLIPSALRPAAGYSRICVDMAYDAPAGVHLSLWRYVQVSGNSCGDSGQVVGFAAVRPDRIRYEFSWNGRTLSMKDGAGVELRYLYEQAPVAQADLGKLTTVYEPRSCTTTNAAGTTPTAADVPASCRAFRFAYNNYPPTAGQTATPTIDVQDPANRHTVYTFDTALPNFHLTRVVNPDGSQIDYAYGGLCPADVLCSVSDLLGRTTAFSYNSVGVLSQPQVASVTDRRGFATNFSYSAGQVDAVRGSQQRRFAQIDSRGRVHQFEEGAVQAAPVHVTQMAWDEPGATCREPDDRVDNNLCTQRRLGSDGTPDDVVHRTWNSEGGLLVERRENAGPDPTTTFGYTAQYVGTGNSVLTYTDAVQGNGNVASAGPATGRKDATTLYYLSDQTQRVTPRGNEVGATFNQYLTQYRRDAVVTVGAGAVPAANEPNPCNTGAPSRNTGLLCEELAPSPSSVNDSDGLVAKTIYSYDAFGQKLTMTTPKAFEQLAGGSPPCPQGIACYVYTYFADSDKDLTSTVSAGGWLRRVTDPTGEFAAFGYDPAGNVVRTWDRDATHGLNPNSFPGTWNIRPQGANGDAPYAEKRYSSSFAFANPWRYVVSESNQMGNRTDYTLDRHGNRRTIRPPRGTYGSGTSAFDITQTFDNNDNLLTRQTPVEAAAGAPAVTYGYDAFNNRVSERDGRGSFTVLRYDEVNRLVAKRMTRGSTADTAVPEGCDVSGAADTPIPSGRVVCQETYKYDAVDNRIEVKSAKLQKTAKASVSTFDGLHRELTRTAPRNADGIGTVKTETRYDVDGNAVVVCDPRQFSTAGSPGCSAAPAFGEQRSYNRAGKLIASSRYRDTGDSTDTTGAVLLTTRFGYDGDGNQTSVADANNHVTTTRYDLLDRKTAVTDARGKTEAWKYSPAGDATAVLRPGAASDCSNAGQQAQCRITAYSYDAAHRLIDTVEGASSTDANALVPSTGTGNTRTRLEYDADGHVIARFEPRAFAAYGPSSPAPDARFMTRYDYDADGRPKAQYTPRFDAVAATDQGGSGEQSQQCSTSVRPDSITEGVGYPGDVGVCVTKISYDANGNRTTIVLPTAAGSATSNRRIQIAYTDDNLVARVNVPAPGGTGDGCAASPGAGRVNAACYTYDATGKPLTLKDALNRVSETVYSDDGLVVRTSDPAGAQQNGLITTHTRSTAYDAAGNKIAETDDAGLVTATAYTNDNLVRSTTDPAGGVTSYTYDGVGNPLAVMSPSANACDVNNCIAGTGKGQPIRYTYLEDNLVSTISTPVRVATGEWRRTTFGYDAGDRKTSQNVAMTSGPLPTDPVTDDAGTQTFIYTPNDRLACEKGRGSERIATTYDAAGNRLTVTDTTGVTTVASCDANGNLQNGGGAAPITSTYYLDGLVRTVDYAGRSTRFNYDGSGRVTGRQSVVSGSGSGWSTTYTYSDAGLPATMSNASFNSASGGGLSWVYDLAGRLVTETTQNAETKTYTHNTDDTLRSMTTSVGGAPTAVWTYNYDNDRRIVDQSFAGTAATTGALMDKKFSYRYEFHRLAGFIVDGTPEQTLSWDYDGNRTRFGTSQFLYNADDSIRETITPEFDRPSYYDAAGALLDDGGRCYKYDGFDRLSQAADRLGGGVNLACRDVLSTMPSVKYAYDGLDRQVSRTETTGTTRLHYDGQSQSIAVETSPSGTDTVFELDPAGSPKALLVNSLVAQTKEYLDTDGQGNVSVVSEANGAVKCTARFDPYGTPQYATTTHGPGVCNTGTAVNDHWYRSGRQDGTTGSYQFGSRTYDPFKGSFLTPDTHRNGTPDQNLSVGVDPLTRNTYSYVNGDPVNLVDPSGHVSKRFCEGNGLSKEECDEVNSFVGTPSEMRAAKRNLARRNAEVVTSKGDRIKYFEVPVHPEYGDVRIRVFIMSERAGFGAEGPLLGDNSPFDQTASPESSRAYIDINYEEGYGYVRANHSCTAVVNVCKEALPFSTDFGSVAQVRMTNAFKINFDKKGGAHIRFQVANSVLPGSPFIDAKIDINWNSKRHQLEAAFDGDAYPSYEIHQWLPNQIRTLFVQRECRLGAGVGLTPPGSWLCRKAFDQHELEPGPFGQSGSYGSVSA